MDSRTLKALEFGKVLEILAGMCVSEAGQRTVAALVPLEDVDAVSAAHTLFDEVRTWTAESGFRLVTFPDLDGLFPHLEKMGSEGETSPLLLDADAQGCTVHCFRGETLADTGDSCRDNSLAGNDAFRSGALSW